MQVHDQCNFTFSLSLAHLATVDPWKKRITLILYPYRIDIIDIGFNLPLQPKKNILLRNPEYVLSESELSKANCKVKCMDLSYQESSVLFLHAKLWSGELDFEVPIDPGAPYRGFLKTYIFWNPIQFPWKWDLLPCGLFDMAACWLLYLYEIL